MAFTPFARPHLSKAVIERKRSVFRTAFGSESIQIWRRRVSRRGLSLATKSVSSAAAAAMSVWSCTLPLRRPDVTSIHKSPTVSPSMDLVNVRVKSTVHTSPGPWLGRCTPSVVARRTARRRRAPAMRSAACDFPERLPRSLAQPNSFQPATLWESNHLLEFDL